MHERIKPYLGDVIVELTWFRTEKRGDICERFKDLYDALQSETNYGYGPYENDRQIAKEVKLRVDDAVTDEILLEVRPY